MIGPGLAAELASLGDDVALANHIFDAIDADGDGHITRHELSCYLTSRDFWVSEANIAPLFAELDTDADGIISRGELLAALRSTAVAVKPLPLWLMALQPPPAGVGVFADLVRSGGAVVIPDAAHRAMTLRQLVAVQKHAFKRCADEGWLGVRFDGGKHYARLQSEDVNLYDVSTHVILPATHGHWLPDGATRPSFVELVADCEQPPDYFVSHFWGEPIADFVACIAQHTRDRGYGGGVCETHPNFGGGLGSDGQEARVWVCAYANRQWSLGNEITDDPSQTSFAKAMRLSSGTIAVIDVDGMYFKRVWCAFEIFMSLQMKEEEHGVDASGTRRYTYDVYTKLTHTPRGNAFGRLGERQAVGLVDGVAPADTAFASALYESGWKAVREEPFPPALMLRAMRARVEDGEASVAADRRHILNCIAGNGRDLNAEVLGVHPRYDEVNTILHGGVATNALTAAIAAGGELLDVALLALAASRVTRVGIFVKDLETATEEVMKRVVAALPTSLEVLSIRYCSELREMPRIGDLTQLRMLDLYCCQNLQYLPDISKLTQLQTLNMASCDSLQSLPDVSVLTSLSCFTKPSHLA